MSGTDATDYGDERDEPESGGMNINDCLLMFSDIERPGRT
jgi:hypothetical protein